eukprot:CAMPEP_0175112490 /NCGR_PEP_ID=MMETSP0086_2-20121207/15521_1 /TAXON_ID=136419 /ORGANISM="Unknown Unknown, Strain D1" /LENGTH=486 /DNA_ID=CAMNT_0016391417 /DNA_START=145 /DNA_END=1605 /DNA_ORIENTATION=-
MSARAADGTGTMQFYKQGDTNKAAVNQLLPGGKYMVELAGGSQQLVFFSSASPGVQVESPKYPDCKYADDNHDGSGPFTVVLPATWTSTDKLTVTLAYATGYQAVGVLTQTVPQPPPTPPTPPTSASPTAPTASPPSAPPTPAPAANQVSVKDLVTTYDVKGDDITFTVKAPGKRWISWGVNTSPKMVGSDVVVCGLDLKVTKYMLMDKNPPTQGTDVTGQKASCTYDGTGTTLEYTRSLKADGAGVDISLTGGTLLVGAYGNVGDPFKYHGANKGSVSFTGKAEKKKPGAAFWAHVAFMGLSWGSLLPFGVSWIRFQRMNDKKMGGKPIWFYVHENCQYLGWLFQIVGFVCAIVGISQEGGVHFGSGNAAHKIVGLVAVVLGTLQPVNAFFRPHPHPDIGAGRGCSDARIRWEYIHKGSGYMATLLGGVNVFLGLALTVENYVVSFVGLAGFFTGVLSIIWLYILFKQITVGYQDPRPVANKLAD